MSRKPFGTGLPGALALSPSSQIAPAICFGLLRAIIPGKQPVAPARVVQRLPYGFTLIEIMVVIVILGVLAALVVPSVLSRTDDARNVAAKSDLAAIRQALKLYRLDNQRYPTTEQGLAALVTRPADPPVPPNWKPGGYLEKLPRDPWGHAYQYLNPGLKSDVDVFTYGADGQPGGTGADADIGSWDL